MRLLNRVVWAIGAVAALWLVVLACTANGLFHLAFTVLFLLLWGGTALLIDRLSPLPHWVCLLVASLVCLIPRIAVLVLLPVDLEPVHDFSTYFKLADSFAQTGEFVESSCNLFPHILFYALWLSIPFRIFGSSILTYQLWNLAFSLGTMLLLYVLMNQLLQRKAAFLAALMFGTFPTLILYAPLNCHEHLVLFLIVLFLCVFFWFVQHVAYSSALWVAAGVGLGVVLLALDMIRPLALVLILTCLCWLILTWRKEAWTPSPVILLVTVVLFVGIFVGGKSLIYRAADHIRPEPLARSSYGFTLLVGSNADCKGTWNQEDSTFFLDTMKATYDDGFCYEEGTAQIMEVVKERYTELGLAGFCKLAAEKNTILWGGQRSVLNYLTSYRDETRSSLLDHPMLVRSLGYCCDGAVSACLLMVAFVCLYRLFRPEPSANPGLFGVVGFLGFVCMHTLTEAAGRYTVSALPLVLLAVVCGFYAESGPKGGRLQF